MTRRQPSSAQSDSEGVAGDDLGGRVDPRDAGEFELSRCGSVGIEVVKRIIYGDVGWQLVYREPLVLAVDCSHRHLGEAATVAERASGRASLELLPNFEDLVHRSNQRDP